jgi:hypothetical protein
MIGITTIIGILRTDMTTITTGTTTAGTTIVIVTATTGLPVTLTIGVHGEITVAPQGTTTLTGNDDSLKEEQKHLATSEVFLHTHPLYCPDVRFRKVW